MKPTIKILWFVLFAFPEQQNTQACTLRQDPHFQAVSVDSFHTSVNKPIKQIKTPQFTEAQQTDEL